MKKRCFSLVELVVVVVLLAVVAVILLIWLRSAAKRRQAQLVGCMDNMKQLQVALQMYGDDNRSYLPDGNNATGLATLLRLGYVKDGKLLICPGTKDTPADNWQAFLQGDEQHCSYLYNGGLYMNDLTPQKVILRDKAENHRKVQQTIMGDFTVKQEKD